MGPARVRSWGSLAEQAASCPGQDSAAAVDNVVSLETGTCIRRKLSCLGSLLEFSGCIWYLQRRGRGKEVGVRAGCMKTDRPEGRERGIFEGKQG